MKQKKFVSLMMIALLLAGCDGNKTSSGSAIASTPSATAKPSEKVTEAKTSASALTSEKSPLASLVEALKTGYTRNLKLTYQNAEESTVTDTGYLSSGEDSFSYYEPSYVFGGEVIAEKKEFYEKGENDSLLLCYLNFNNEAEKAKYSGTEKFSDYANAFASVKESDFVKDGEDYSLSKESASYPLLASELKTAKEDLEYFKVSLKEGGDSFSFKIKGKDLVDSYETKLGEGTLLTGGDNLIKVTKIEETEDPLFAKGRKWIQDGNYNRKSTFSKYDSDIGDFVPASVYTREADKENSLSIKAYDGTRNLITEEGISKAENGDLQACVVINNERYPDGKLRKGTLSSALPSPEISSVFFDKTYTRKGGTSYKVAIYQLKKSLPVYLIGDTFDVLDPFADKSRKRKDLSIAVSDSEENEFVQIIDENESRRYRVLYSDFGQVLLDQRELR